MTNSRSAITLPVTDIETSKRFYLAALAPIGYAVVSPAPRRLEDGSSDTYSFGPVNTRRVDLTIAQSSKSARRTREENQPRICLTAMAAPAVEDFYDEARARGGASVTPPSKGQRGYTAAVHDPDGNHVEVVFRDSKYITTPEAPRPASPPSTKESSIQRWRENVADEKTPGGVIQPDATGTLSRTPSIAPSTKTSLSRKSVSPPKAPASNASRGIDARMVLDTVAMGTVGTTLVIDGAKVIVEAVDDSKARGKDLTRRVSRRSDLETEAHASTRRNDATAQAPRKTLRRRSSHEDRDSGYYSVTTARNSRRAPARSSSNPHRRTSSSPRRPGPAQASVRESQPRTRRTPPSTAASARVPPDTRPVETPRSHITVSQAPSKPLPLSFRRAEPRPDYRTVYRDDKGYGDGRSRRPARRVEYVVAEPRTRGVKSSGSPPRRTSSGRTKESSRTMRYAPVPESRASMARTSEGSKREEVLDRDDEETLVPGDSISQVSY